ncbi:AAA-associated domain-containing protein [Thermogladius sp. KZ2Tp1]|uniref:AAA-associated domain-containing protein n=1 Tax=Thermogladius TaxID=477695 RepID=UPI000A55ADD9|nr:AAA-associated domain-containing protein [Thermogladius calderae]
MSQDTKKIVLPYYLTPDHLLGLVEALHSLGGKADPMNLGDLLGENIDILPHVIDVAESLGLVAIAPNGDVVLTELGERIVTGNIKNVKKLLRENAKRVEPLSTLLDVLSRRKVITSDEYESVLSQYYHLHLNDAKRNILQWGAFLGLFKMDANDEYVYLLHSK